MIDSVKADKIISSILEAPSESRNVELKPSIPWKDINKQHQLQDIVKSIIGMSNIRDGGKIILGILQKPNRTFQLTGMKKEDLKTYEQDNIYQIVRAYGNPKPRFEIKNAEYKGKQFIVFIIQEFLYSPIICIKNGSKTGKEPLIKGTIYIRTHKPETKKVSEETEMREIINLAIDKEIDVWTPRIQRLISKKPTGFIVAEMDDLKKFDNEIKEFNL